MSWFERSAEMTPEKRLEARAQLLTEFAATEYAQVIAEILDDIRQAAVVEIVNGAGDVALERGKVAAVQEMISRMQLVVALDTRRRAIRQEQEMNLLQGEHWRTYGSEPGLV